MVEIIQFTYLKKKDRKEKKNVPWLARPGPQLLPLPCCISPPLPAQATNLSSLHHQAPQPSWFLVTACYHLCIIINQVSASHSSTRSGETPHVCPRFRYSSESSHHGQGAPPHTHTQEWEC